LDLVQLEAFLIVAEELHFGRAAERLYLSQARVSRLVASLEGEVGGRLFDRTSRKVVLTPLGIQLREDLQPAYEQIRSALERGRRAARGVTGTLRIGFTSSTEGEAVTRLVAAFETAHADCEVELREVPIADPFPALHGGEIDVLVNWLDRLTDYEPELTAGPMIAQFPRVLAVSTNHPLAARESVSYEQVASYDVVHMPASFPTALMDVLVPPVTPSGRQIHRNVAVSGFHEVLSLVALGRIVHPTVPALPVLRDDIRLIPLSDLPPMTLGLIWRTAHANSRILALADVAQHLTSPNARHDAMP
jgi:DNA-binding transcriptional LysR family regulator